MPNPVILGIDDIFEEKGNRFSRFERVKWDPESDKSYIDIRRYEMNAQNEEVAGKGFTFMTEDGPAELSKAIIRNDFGTTEEYIEELAKRDDFVFALKNCQIKGAISDTDITINKEFENSDEFYDANDFI